MKISKNMAYRTAVNSLGLIGRWCHFLLIARAHWKIIESDRSWQRDWIEVQYKFYFYNPMTYIFIVALVLWGSLITLANLIRRRGVFKQNLGDFSRCFHVMTLTLDDQWSKLPYMISTGESRI